MKIPIERPETGVGWFILGGGTLLISVVTSLALQSIEPLFYTVLPAEGFILVGLLHDRKEFSDSIMKLALAILFGGAAEAFHFALNDQIGGAITGIASLAFFVSPFFNFAFEGIACGDKKERYGLRP